ncbi:MAG: hydrogenase maturation nickel metallochaperone HypA [bacterium]|nr:hydrogenase maturation nickel metallochaperone HypA [bacterium]
MHEASLMKNLMAQIQRIARDQGAKRIVGIKVKLGALSHMSPEHFQEHFDQISPGTLAEGAVIEAMQLTDLQDPHAQDILIESIEVE